MQTEHPPPICKVAIMIGSHNKLVTIPWPSVTVITKALTQFQRKILNPPPEIFQNLICKISSYPSKQFMQYYYFSVLEYVYLQNVVIVAE